MPFCWQQTRRFKHDCGTVPLQEVDRFLQTVIEAIQMADRGRVDWGYWHLVHAMDAIKSLEWGYCPWRGALLERYECVLDDFCASYLYCQCAN